MASTRTVRASTVGDQVYARLRTMVLDFELAPGQALAETDLSERLGVSRTPVREALVRLAREGLVRQYPGRGAFVSEIALPDIVELYQMREALEGYAAGLAAASLAAAGAAGVAGRSALQEILVDLESARASLEAGDTDSYYALVARMDDAIVELAGNERLAVALSEVWAQVTRARRMATHSPDRLLETIDEHAAILRAILDGDAELAESQTRVHVRHSLANVTASLTRRFRGATV